MKFGGDYDGINYFEIVNKKGIPYLKTGGNPLLKGSLFEDPVSHQLHYRFSPLFQPLGSIQQPAEHIGFIYPEEMDQRNIAEVTLDPANPENNTIHVRYDQRDAMYLGETVEIFAKKWKESSEVTRTLVGCELHDEDEESTRPPFCNTIPVAGSPVGSRCTTTANAAVYERIKVAQGGYDAWRDGRGLAWSDFMGEYSTRDEAIKACAEMGAELPTIADINAGITDNFEEAIQFSEHMKNDKKTYWMNSKLVYSGGQTYDAVFSLTKFAEGPPSVFVGSLNEHHYGIDDSIEGEEERNFPKPYGAFCVWRNRAKD